MKVDNNLILYLPFDDPDGDTAYDYSKNRADGVLTNGAFLSRDGKIGKSLDLNGSGECTTSQTIPFSSDFTISLYVKPTTDKLGWIVNFSGLNNFLEHWISVKPNEFCFLAFVKKGNQFLVYAHGSVVYSATLPSTPVGFSINDHNLSGNYASIDDLQLFNEAKTPDEIRKIQRDTDVEYYIDGTNFKEFGVFVSGSAGLVGRLERKEALTVDWENYHGIVRDNKRPRYKSRTITLDCFIQASSRSAYVEWVDMFFAQFDKEGTQRFMVEYDGKAKTLVYEVVCIDETDTEKKWGSYNEDLMVGAFKLKLIENEPVKKVLKHIGATANTSVQIDVTSSKLLNIYWGDGTHTFGVSGTKTVEHTYSEPGIYDIIITGVIEDIEQFSTNAITVWDRLL